MRRFADAEEQSKKAVSVRLSVGPVHDPAVSIENLQVGQVYNEKDHFAEAKRVKLSPGLPENIMVCGNYNVHVFLRNPVQTFDRSQLSSCSSYKVSHLQG
jgi:hypothetical protein